MFYQYPRPKIPNEDDCGPGPHCGGAHTGGGHAGTPHGAWYDTGLHFVIGAGAHVGGRHTGGAHGAGAHGGGPQVRGEDPQGSPRGAGVGASRQFMMKAGHEITAPQMLVQMLRHGNPPNNPVLLGPQEGGGQGWGAHDTGAGAHEGGTYTGGPPALTREAAETMMRERRHNTTATNLSTIPSSFGLNPSYVT